MALVGSPSSVLSKGIGSWGSVNLMVTRGLGVAEAVVVNPRYAVEYQIKVSRDATYAMKISRVASYQVKL